MKIPTLARPFALARTLLSAASLLLAAGGANLQAQADGRLSAEAQARADSQIAAVVKDKAARTPAQRKMDSHLIYAAREATAGKAFDGLPKYRSNAKVAKDGSVEVDIKGKITPDLLAAIAAKGGKIVNSHPESGAVRVTLPLLNVEAIAARPEVRFIALPPKVTVHTGSVDAESDQTMLAAQARQTYGVTGAGVSVGVMSDSIDNGKGGLAAAYASGDLDQANTFIIPGQDGGAGEGEGGAMMQIIHDIAPGAKLYFATGFGGAAGFATNIRALAAAGCKVIVDDITLGNESPFQDQEISQAVDAFCAGGGMYFSATGNGGNKEQNTATAWEGDFKDGGDASGITFSASRYHAFTNADGTTVNGDQLTSGDGSGIFFWSDPLGASSNDYDLYEVDSTGAVVNMSTNTQDGTQDPYENFDGAKQGDSLVIVKAATAAARFLHLETGEGSKLAVGTTGNLRGHNGPTATTGMFAVAAAPCAVSGGAPGDPTGPYPNAFSSTSVTEQFSSDGPRRIFYAADGTPFTPGNVSSTGGRVFAHPDITAGDGVTTAYPGFAPFFGTSAAAPDAAAVAALLLSKYPTLTPVQADAAMRAGVVQINETAATAGAGILLVPNVLASAAAAVAPIINSATTASGQVGVAFSYQITATGAPTSYAATGLPTGVTLDTATGLISGTPTVSGSYPVTLTATNASGFGTGMFVLTVFPAPLGLPVINSATTATVQTGTPFTYQITATNSPTSFAASGLPAGLNLDPASGLITGTPTVVGGYAVSLTASNATGSGVATLSLTVTAPPLGLPVITSATTASVQVGQPFSYQIAATNSPSIFAASGLPAGLSLDPASGLITGTPTVAGNFVVPLEASNATGTAKATLELTVTAVPVAPPVITSAVMASAQVGMVFSYQIVASNAPTSYSVTGLPPGLSVDAASGMITGTPTGAAGTFTVTLYAINAGGTGMATLTLTLTAVPIPPTVSVAAGGDGHAQYGVENGLFVFLRTGDTSAALTVFYKIKGPAKAGVDFKLVTGQVVFPVGSAKAKLKIKPLLNPENTGKLKLKLVLLPSPDGSYAPASTAAVHISVFGVE